MLYFIIFNLFLFSFSVLPYWNLTIQSSDLFENKIEYNYSITHRHKNSYIVEMKKNISKNSIGNITYENKLYFNGKFITNVEFENIDSFYFDKDNNNLSVLCPMGKYNPINITTMEEIKNNDIHQNESDWNLKCYNLSNGYFFIFYLNKGKNQVYNLDLVNNSFYKIPELQTYEEMYDFKLENKKSPPTKYFLQMCVLCEKDGYVRFFALKIPLESPNFIIMKQMNKKLIRAKNYSQATFNNYTNDFYYFTYNNVSDFSSGFSNKTVEGDNYYINDNDVDVVNNYASPFEFIDEVEIKEMKFIYYTKYVYYSIYNIKTKEAYHGVLDTVFSMIVRQTIFENFFN